MAIQRAKPLIKANLKLYIENLFLKLGFYTNVDVADTDIYGNDISLMMDGEVVYPSPGALSSVPGKVWQSPFKNWTHEDGIGAAESGILPPTVASGVFVNGTFYSSGTVGAFAHTIDYTNGRVIFGAPISAGSLVQTNFSYKTISVESADAFGNENRPLLIETGYKDNPMVSGVDIYPVPEAQTLPAIFIDFARRDNAGYELGKANGIRDYYGTIHIWARDEYLRDIIEDILGDEERRVLAGIDFNTAPDPLIMNGAKNPDYSSYNDLAVIWGQHFWHRIYLEEMRPRSIPPLRDIERGSIEFKIRVYGNF